MSKIAYALTVLVAIVALFVAFTPAATAHADLTDTSGPYGYGATEAGDCVNSYEFETFKDGSSGCFLPHPDAPVDEAPGDVDLSDPEVIAGQLDELSALIPGEPPVTVGPTTETREPVGLPHAGN